MTLSEKLFTVEEANALLPRLEVTFQEIEGKKEELERQMDRIKVLDALWGEKIKDPENPDRGEFLDTRAEVRRAIGEIEALVEEEILSLGLRFPPGGLEHGLVDFPTSFEGRVVYLCWQRGEDRVRAWHEVHGGFKGRKSLTAEQASRMGRDEEGEG